MPPGDKSEHSRDDLWGRINSQSESIAEIRAGQAATDARLGALESAVEQGFRSIASEIHGLAERVNTPKEQTNPVVLLVAFVTILGLFGSFALLIAKPIETDTMGNNQKITRLEDRAYAHEGRISSLEADNRALKKTLEEVDLHGSRHWVDRRD